MTPDQPFILDAFAEEVKSNPDCKQPLMEAVRIVCVKVGRITGVGKNLSPETAEDMVRPVAEKHGIVDSARDILKVRFYLALLSKDISSESRLFCVRKIIESRDISSIRKASQHIEYGSNEWYILFPVLVAIGAHLDAFKVEGLPPDSPESTQLAHEIANGFDSETVALAFAAAHPESDAEHVLAEAIVKFEDPELILRALISPDRGDEVKVFLAGALKKTGNRGLIDKALKSLRMGSVEYRELT